MKVAFMTAALWLGPTLASAQAPSAPPIVTEGLKVLRERGIRQSVQIWFEGSALASDSASANQVVRQFDNLPAWVGHPVGYDVVRTFLVGTHLSRTYVLILCQGAPVFMRFDYYLSSKGWILQHLDFNIDGQRVFSDALLAP